MWSSRWATCTTRWSGSSGATTLAVTAAALGGLGLGLVLHDKAGMKLTGAICYATAGAMEVYAALTPKTRERRAAAETRPEARAA